MITEEEELALLIAEQQQDLEEEQEGITGHDMRDFVVGRGYRPLFSSEGRMEGCFQRAMPSLDAADEE